MNFPIALYTGGTFTVASSVEGLNTGDHELFKNPGKDEFGSDSKTVMGRGLREELRSYLGESPYWCEPKTKGG